MRSVGAKRDKTAFLGVSCLLGLAPHNLTLGLDFSPKSSRNCATMNSFINLTPQQLRKAANVQERIVSLQKQLSQLLGAPVRLVPGAARKKRTMSAAGRARIAAAARARWAKIRGAKRAARPVQKPRRKISAAGRARLAALARARWKAAKAQGKKAL